VDRPRVKGVRFQELRDAGDPAELAAFFTTGRARTRSCSRHHGDSEGRSILLDAVARTADQVSSPLTVGGGVRMRPDVAELLTPALTRCR